MNDAEIKSKYEKSHHQREYRQRKKALDEACFYLQSLDEERAKTMVKIVQAGVKLKQWMRSHE